jgi:lysozyme
VTRAALNQNQFDALASFVFNVGQGNYAQSTLRRALEAGHLRQAALEFNRWVWATAADGKKIALPGLIKRRGAERTLFETNP